MRGPPPAAGRSVLLTVSLLFGVLIFLTLSIPPAFGHDPQDQILAQVGVAERLGARIPGGLPFRDQDGKNVLLSDYFTGEPVLLTLNYYACPSLCPLVFRNLAGTIGRLSDLKLARDFRVVTVSINPEESPVLAREKSALTYARLGAVAVPGSRWPFLLGNRNSIERLAQAVGLRYARVGDRDFAHPSVVVAVTPDGRVSRYLYGLELRPQDLKLALLEASGGRIGTAGLMNQALLYCFHYDPVGKKYVLFASRLMTVVMLGVLALTLAMLALLWKGERRRPPV